MLFKEFFIFSFCVEFFEGRGQNLGETIAKEEQRFPEILLNGAINHKLFLELEGLRHEANLSVLASTFLETKLNLMKRIVIEKSEAQDDSSHLQQVVLQSYQSWCFPHNSTAFSLLKLLDSFVRVGKICFQYF